MDMTTTKKPVCWIWIELWLHGWMDVGVERKRKKRLVDG